MPFSHTGLPHETAVPAPTETLHEDAHDFPHRGTGAYAPPRGRVLGLSRALAVVDYGRDIIITYSYTEQTPSPHAARIVWTVPVVSLIGGHVVGASGTAPAKLGQLQGLALVYDPHAPSLRVVTRFANAITDSELNGRITVTLR